MQMKMLANGTVRILLTDRELAHFHADFFNLRENDPKTAAALHRILKAACPDMLKTTKRRQLSVEAAPIEGGCLLFISPQNAREETLFCLCAADTAALCALLAAAKRTLGGNTVAAVYRLADRFFLLLYGAPFPDVYKRQTLSASSGSGSGFVSSAVKTVALEIGAVG